LAIGAGFNEVFGWQINIADLLKQRRPEAILAVAFGLLLF
jgi:hypothetical protein